MIAHKIFRYLSTTNLARLSKSQARASQQPQETSPSAYQQAKSVNQTPVEEPRDDELYRYLWIKCSGHEVQVLDSYEKFLKLTAEHLDINYVRTKTPFRVIKRKTMLASRFVHKKYRVQYEVRTYFRDLLFKNLTGSTTDTFLEYTQRNLPDGVMMIAEKHRLAELPFDLTANETTSTSPT